MAHLSEADYKFYAAFGSSIFDDLTTATWTDLTSTYRPRNLTITRGRPSEFERYKPARASFELVDTTSRNLDPNNLSGSFTNTLKKSSYPVVGNHLTTKGTSLGAGNTVTLPDGVSTGELILCFVSVDNPGATALETGAGSATYSSFTDQTESGDAVVHGVFWRIATGSDTLVLDGPAEDYVITVIRVLNHGLSAEGDLLSSRDGDTTGNINPPSRSFTHTETENLIFACGALDLTHASHTIDKGPSFDDGLDWVEVDTDYSAATTTAVGQGLFYLFTSAVSSADPGSMNNDSNAWQASTIIVKPKVTSETVTQIVPDLPIKITAEMDSLQTVLDDDFSTSPLHTYWRRIKNSTFTETDAEAAGNQLDLKSLNKIETEKFYNFEGDSIAQFGVVDDGSTPDTYFGIDFADAGDVYFHVDYNGGTRLLRYAATGGFSNNVSWNDTNHRYLRIRIESTTIYFDRSSDGTNWTMIDSTTKSTSDRIGKVYARNEASSSDITLDDFKIQVTKFERFLGTVDNWDYEPLGGNQGSIVNVSATDAFKTFSTLALEAPYSTLPTSVGIATTAWFRFNERFGTFARDSTEQWLEGLEVFLSGAHGRYNPISTELGQDPIFKYLGGSAVKLAREFEEWSIELPDSGRVSDQATFLFWYQAERFGDNGQANSYGRLPKLIYSQENKGSTLTDRGLAVWIQPDNNSIDSNGRIINWFLHIQDSDGSSASDHIDYGFPELTDGLPHMIALSFSSGDFLRVASLWVDGKYVASGEQSSYTTQVPIAGNHIGNTKQGLRHTVSFPAVIDEFTIFQGFLSADKVKTFYEYGTNPWAGDSIGTRIGRLLDQVDWPDGLRTIDDGSYSLGPADIDGEELLDELFKLDRTEGGRFYIGRHGEVIFTDEGRAVTRKDDAVTFADTVSRPAEPNLEINILDEGFVQRTDDDRLFTAASLSREGGVRIYYEDILGRGPGAAQLYLDGTRTDAVARFGVREFSESGLQMSHDSQVYARAVAIVEKFKEPVPRFETFSVAPQKKITTWPLLLNLDLGDSAQVAFTTLATGDSYSDYFHVDAITERYEDGGVVFDITCSPEHPGAGTFLEWDASGDTGWDMGVWR